ncbi:MAG: leucine-rich repeat domain-containing protein [Ruminococcus sp.]|nr:leucine-rich repeat domain-containing protein [Ruminococcus sp.]
MAFIINNGVLKRYDPEPDELDIVIPDDVVEIGERVFRGSGIRSVTIPSSVKIIGEEAFDNCRNLTKVTLNNGLENIKKYAFHGSSINEIVLPETVKTIGKYAFRFSNIESINIPEKVKKLSKYFCDSCMRLKNISVSEKNTKYTSVDGVLFDKSINNLILYPCAKKDSCYAIPDGVTTIQRNSFANCKHLESIIIPDSVHYIEKYSFNVCLELQHITIHDGIMEVDRKAFYSRKKISDITIVGGKTTVKASADFQTSDYNFKADTMRFIDCATSSLYSKLKSFSEIKDTALKIPLAIFLSFEYDDPTINAYLKRNIRRVVKYLADAEDAENLTKLLDMGYITKKNVDDLISYAVNAKKPEIQLILSNFKNDSIGYRNEKVFDNLML